MDLDKPQFSTIMELEDMFKRTIENAIEKYLRDKKDHKILFIWGPRRSGKTTLLNKLAKKLGVKKFNFDLQSDRKKFLPRRETLELLAKENRVILIDEIQNYPEVTVVLKILYDEFGVKIIATGSSELRQKASKEFDSLAGRFNEIYCLPLSVFEILANENPLPSDKITHAINLANRLQIFGAYPEVYLAKNNQTDSLQHILDAYVLKDIIDIYNLKNTKLAKDILTKIALQLGSEVSTREIADSLGASHSTVADYIEIFVKNYILISLPSFGVNTRKAVSENRKLYFYDLGIRNILVQDFRNIDLRPDKGGVFENFIISEIEKTRKVNKTKVNLYFYREYGGKEIDLVLEDYFKKYQAVEIKIQGRGGNRNIFPLPHSFVTINQSNYFEIITKSLL